MTISRGQMKRQLYMGGGIMDVVPRDKFFLGKVAKAVKKTVKKVTKGIGDIISSDAGKLALLGLGGYGLATGSFGLPKLAMPNFLTSNVGKNLAMGAAGALFGGAFAGKSEEEVEAITRDKGALKSYLTQYYTNLNPELRNQPEKVAQFVESQITEYNQGRGGYAIGGRMGFEEGADEKIKMIKDMISRGADDDTIMSITGASQAEIDQIKNSKATGGIMDTASDNAMQAAGIEGLPVRQNPKGVKELDLRETGGFIPPVGIKEKEDDIPAMLSNNEFVFTADAVRGAGDGDVNLGAQRMYDTMKRLEAGGKA